MVDKQVCVQQQQQQQVLTTCAPTTHTHTFQMCDPFVQLQQTGLNTHMCDTDEVLRKKPVFLLHLLVHLFSVQHGIWTRQDEQVGSHHPPSTDLFQSGQC